MSILNLTHGATLDGLGNNLNALVNGQDVRFTKTPVLSYLYRNVTITMDDYPNITITDSEGDIIEIHRENGRIIKVLLIDSQKENIEYYYVGDRNCLP